VHVIVHVPIFLALTFPEELTVAILVFDDSFSALDYKTDAKLREGLNEKLKDTTKIIVAQRISTIRHADKIIVLDRGEAVGMGTHDELMKNCDVYKEIALSQLSAAELA
jgi:ABC-type multidrug transport system fused ATPase/permease subunit